MLYPPTPAQRIERILRLLVSVANGGGVSDCGIDDDTVEWLHALAVDVRNGTFP